MIGVKFNGRLGNQLFQLAFFQYLKSNNKEYTYFFVNPHHSYLTKYFDLEGYHNQTLGSKLYSILTRIIIRIKKFKEIYIQNIQVPRAVSVENWHIYKGFFQTDWYYKHIIGGLKIEIKKIYVDKFNIEFGAIFDKEKTVVIHIRRTDYMNYGKRDISLPLEYFKKRLDSLGDVSDHRIFFVSDDIEHVKSYFTPKPNYIFSSNNEITDFQIIKNADIAIISNSSFAWWASYLSTKPKKVYAPKNWLGFRIGKEHPKKIMTEKFIWCDVL